MGARVWKCRCGQTHFGYKHFLGLLNGFSEEIPVTPYTPAEISALLTVWYEQKFICCMDCELNQSTETNVKFFEELRSVLRLLTFKKPK